MSTSKATVVTYNFHYQTVLHYNININSCHYHMYFTKHHKIIVYYNNVIMYTNNECIYNLSARNYSLSRPGSRPPLASGTRHLTANRTTQKAPQGPSPCSSLSSGSASVTPPNDIIANDNRGTSHSSTTPTASNSMSLNNHGVKTSASFTSPPLGTRQEEPHQGPGPEERTHRRQGSDTSRPDKLKLFSHLKRSPNHSLFRVRSNIEQSPTKKQQQQQQHHTFVQPKGNPVSARINQFGGGSRPGSTRDQKKQPQYQRTDHHERKPMTRHLSNEELSAPAITEKRETRRTHERRESDGSEDMKSSSYPLLQGGGRRHQGKAS